LAADRSEDHFASLKPILTSLDYPILEKIADVREGILKGFFRPILLRRLLNNEKKVADPKTTLTLPEFFNWMTSRFWEELDTGSNISPSRRDLQRMHLNHLVELAVAPRPQFFGTSEIEMSPIVIATVPDDARNLAEYELGVIRGKIKEFLGRRGGRTDTSTRSHLSSSLRLINKALNSRFSESVGGDGGESQEQDQE